MISTCPDSIINNPFIDKESTDCLGESYMDKTTTQPQLACIGCLPVYCSLHNRRKIDREGNVNGRVRRVFPLAYGIFTLFSEPFQVLFSEVWFQQ